VWFVIGMRHRATAACRRRVDPDGEAEREAIERESREAQERHAAREREPQQQIQAIELFRRGWRRYLGAAAEAEEQNWRDHWGRLARPRARATGSRNIASSVTPTDQPREIAWFVETERETDGGVELAFRRVAAPTGGRFLGVGRGGKWWAGPPAPIGPSDSEGRRLAELAADLGQSRARAAELGERVASGELVAVEAAADADGRVVGPLDAATWEPDPAAEGKSRSWWRSRREAARLGRGLLRLQRGRVAACRRYPIGGAVGLHQLHERDSSGRNVTRLSWAGNETCAAVWVCPECSRLIRSRRAVELGQLDEWAGDGARLVSLTIAHRRGDSLAELLAGLANAWRRVCMGAPWRRFRERCRIVGYVRAAEVTHGDAYGWHPHLHVVMIGGPGWERDRIGGRTAAEWLSHRWRAAVVAELGDARRPLLDRGCSVVPLKGSGYLAKMGLELSLDWAKRARVVDDVTHRTPWQIAADWCRWHETTDGDLWREYAGATFGHRQLTWSLGLRKLAGIGVELTDEEIATDVGRRVAKLPAAVWSWLRDGRGARGVPWSTAALEIGEARGVEYLRSWIERKRVALCGDHGTLEVWTATEGATQGLAETQAGDAYCEGRKRNRNVVRKRATAEPIRRSDLPALLGSNHAVAASHELDPGWDVRRPRERSTGSEGARLPAAVTYPEWDESSWT